MNNEVGQESLNFMKPKIYGRQNSDFFMLPVQEDSRP